MHKDPSKTVVGFYRSRTRGNAELKESDRKSYWLSRWRTRFATDFHFYAVLSPPAKSEMALSLAIRKGRENWSDFRPFTCHLNPLSVTSDLRCSESNDLDAHTRLRLRLLNLEPRGPAPAVQMNSMTPKGKPDRQRSSAGDGRDRGEGTEKCHKPVS